MDDDIKQYTRVQIFTQEVFEEEECDLPRQYRRRTAQLQTGSDDLKRSLRAYLADRFVRNPVICVSEEPHYDATKDVESAANRFYNALRRTGLATPGSRMVAEGFNTNAY